MIIKSLLLFNLAICKTVRSEKQACLILVKYSVGPVMCFTFHFGYGKYGFQVFLTVGNRLSEMNMHNRNTFIE